ncbi:CAP domain-containing protein [Nakamurella leprariae]|uniref:SCP domain-containing protein n=1 Tax=Nakamurella leprariae TaxID=2803911 RepID=A0A938YGG1_9ACTN|nr:CAP domain-containing protein [Nakamurella leprariae]MBM9469138.1 hypothetical protein [Nakamurella leprariae]
MTQDRAVHRRHQQTRRRSPGLRAVAVPSAILAAVLAAVVGLAPAAVAAEPGAALESLGHVSTSTAPTAPVVRPALVGTGASGSTAPTAPAAVRSAATAPMPGTPLVPQLTWFDQEMILLVNRARLEAGLTPLVEAEGLTRLALTWTTVLASGGTDDRLEHNPDVPVWLPQFGAGSGSAWGENVGQWTTGTGTPEMLFASYMDSPSHRENILRPEYRFIGMASGPGRAGSDFNTMVFTDGVDADAPVRDVLLPVPDREPVGALDAVLRSGDGDRLRFQGWTMDPDDFERPTQVEFTVTTADGTTFTTGRFVARTWRGDVAAWYGISASGRHGFTVTVPRPAVGGELQVCATAVGLDGGANTLLGCRTLPA